MATLLLALLLLSQCWLHVLSCNDLDRSSLLSFKALLSSHQPLDWSSADCCLWQGISCTGSDSRVTRIWLPLSDLSGTLSPSLANITFLSHLNLSHNHLSGHLLDPILISSLEHLQILDLSSNLFNGSVVGYNFSFNLIVFNISDNEFTGLLPSSICRDSPLLQILDFSANQFSGIVSDGLGECSNLKVFRAGSNVLSGCLPTDLFDLRAIREISLPGNRLSGQIDDDKIVRLSNLTRLILHANELTGTIPPSIGLLSNLEQLQLHTNRLDGHLPSSLMRCTNLRILLLKNNLLGGHISGLDFSRLHKLEAIDLGQNRLVGEIPRSLCACTSLSAIRFAYNNLVGEVPSCFASLTSLVHLSLSYNSFSNVVGSLNTLRHCKNLTVLFMSGCFHDETMPDDNNLSHPIGFQDLNIFVLAGCRLKGQIPSWISKLRKLKILNLSNNTITGPIPSWIGDMPSLFDLNLNGNSLSGNLPCQLFQLAALTYFDNSSLDMSLLPLPFLVHQTLEYKRLFNVRRALKLGENNLSGNIPKEIGKLRLLQMLDLNDNNFKGSIPDQISDLVNLEVLNLARNHLSGEIPKLLIKLHFLSSFSVARNELEGEIPEGAQFDTFTASSYSGNPKLCGNIIKRSCCADRGSDAKTIFEEESLSPWNFATPFVAGYLVGLVTIIVRQLVVCSW